MEYRRDVIDNFGQKMLNSGHSLEETRRNLISGLKGWKSKVARSKKQGMPLHRTAKQEKHLQLAVVEQFQFQFQVSYYHKVATRERISTQRRKYKLKVKLPKSVRIEQQKDGNPY